jgi:hypothetical protein
MPQSASGPVEACLSHRCITILHHHHHHQNSNGLVLVSPSIGREEDEVIATQQEVWSLRDPAVHQVEELDS